MSMPMVGPEADSPPLVLPQDDPATAPRQTLPVVFTGSGSEYFRIWIVNLLLVIVTLTLYMPFARARRLRYFQANTVVGGHALGFHGDPKKMLRGYLIMVLAALLYGLAGHFSPALGMAAFAALALAWPALWRASLQFRLSNTSWRGVRFQFTGDLAGAYRAMLPPFLPSLAMLASTAWIDPAHPEQVNPAAASMMLTVMGVAMLLGLALLPVFYLGVKRYQHGHYRYANQTTELTLGYGAVYQLLLKSIGLGLLGLLALALLAGAGALTFFLARWLGAPTEGPWAQWAPVLLFMLGYLAGIIGLGSYGAARLQNLVWNATTSAQLRFSSQLRFRPLLGLTLKNWCLTLLTLGLYRPFAVVALARLRLQAVTLSSDSTVDDWTGDIHAANRDATGDAAGDFFGIDMGL
jgi:uncharacterized membrane protein YjgN (DUF898 family)